MPISLLAKDDSKLAFTFALRVATPIVYLIIISRVLYYFKLDSFVFKFYLVSIYYLIFRYIINAVEGRLSLLNWGRQIIYSLSIIFLSYFFYDKFISSKKNLLPDFSNLANEMWIIIILFVYKIINDLDVSVKGAEKRKSRYIFKKYILFKTKYGKIIDSQVDNDILKTIIYAIIIYENFNRSRLVRAVENVSYFIIKNLTR
ncbi:hypothetical protein J4D99_03685 [Siccationidurans ginsengisoli]|nr:MULTISPECIES: hypothetical protein [unclassified Hymenobacter]MBO2030483.1 hypothetical protein [Hymenobacter sp. BT559]